MNQSEKTRLRQAAEQAMWFTALIVGILGIAGIISCRSYHLFWHPEWTEAQSLIKLWHFYGASFSCLIFSAGFFWKT